MKQKTSGLNSARTQGNASGPIDYRAMVASIDDCAIFMLDCDGNVLNWNAGAARLKGYTEDEIVGTHFSCFHTPERVAEGWPTLELERALAYGRFMDAGWRVRKDGTKFWANVTLTLLRDDDGEPIGYVKMVRDVTAHREEEERLRHIDERFRLLVESVKDYAIFMLDPDGHVRSWNAGAAYIKGYRPEEIIGQHFSVFYSADDIASGRPVRQLAIAREQGRIEDEGWRVRKDGSMFWANVVIAAIRDEQGLLRGFAKVTRDMSERKKFEELEQSSRRVNEFIATLAHELRNPLAPIRNAVNVMALEPGLSATITHCRDMIDRQISHLTRLVDDLLDMGRITTGKIELRVASLDIADVVARSVEGVRAFTSERRQSIDIDLPVQTVTLKGDMTRLVQVVQNLLNNASKFSRNGTRIKLDIEVQDRNVMLRVSDQGRGIPKESLDSIFNLFVQEDHHLNPGDTGLGIGLTLCRSLVQLHGGAISAASDGRGLGSTFTVRLPLLSISETRDAEQLALGPEESVRGPLLRVLIIDDNRDSADSLAMLMTLKGCEVRVAYHGVEGLASAERFMPHAVFVDLAMPGLDGFDVLDRLRAQSTFANTTVAAVTGYGQLSDRTRSLSRGFDAHLVKPVDLALLDDVLMRAESRRLAAR
ncbi:PAS domain-containing sensor histidine kinase [Caballeronia sp. dw_19]|uniref:PAS domain-containing hybrid sensor histidine kinase/response regulator n=1 Tax=Caballeronia sp. dw_19 TaxID=2719791 RepID=UPI002107088D|nr:PAS domain-containing sensor histidine kinase [Caballeronia sp. dw_19]